MKILIALLLIPLAGCQNAPSGSVSDASGKLHVPATKAGRATGPHDLLPWGLSVVPSADGAYKIHVSDVMGGAIQVIEGPTSEPPFTVQNLLTVKDYNADGWPDISAKSLPVGASAITGEVLFVYDVNQNRFRESDEIVQEGEIQAAKPGCITVEFRNSDSVTYSKDAYCWRGGRWDYKGREAE